MFSYVAKLLQAYTVFAVVHEWDVSKTERSLLTDATPKGIILQGTPNNLDLQRFIHENTTLHAPVWRTPQLSPVIAHMSLEVGVRVQRSWTGRCFREKGVHWQALWRTQVSSVQVHVCVYNNVYPVCMCIVCMHACMYVCMDVWMYVWL